MRSSAPPFGIVPRDHVAPVRPRGLSPRFWIRCDTRLESGDELRACALRRRCVPRRYRDCGTHLAFGRRLLRIFYAQMTGSHLGIKKRLPHLRFGSRVVLVAIAPAVHARGKPDVFYCCVFTPTKKRLATTPHFVRTSRCSSALRSSGTPLARSSSTLVFVSCGHLRRPPDTKKTSGDDLLSHHAAVPSALKGLTSVFGMGTGGTPSL